MTEEGRRLRWVGPQAVVAMPAEIDITNADEIRQALFAAASHGATVLIIDMSGTTFCDSAGVQAIIDLHNRTAASHTQVRLVATAVVRILELVGVDQLIPVYPTLEAALAGTSSAQASTRDCGNDPSRSADSSDPQTDCPANGKGKAE